MSFPRLIAALWLLLPAPLAAGESVGADGPPPKVALADLVRVWECRFDNEGPIDLHWDVNYDGWPDRWDRVYDDAHPTYATMAIVPTGDPDVSGSALRIAPDGASATALSPPIRILPKFSYKLRLRAKVTGAEHGVARVRMAFFARDKSRQVEQSPPFKADGRWHDIELGDYQPRSADVDRVIVEVDYERGPRGDLDAEVSVADFRLYRLPSIRIHTGSRYNVYTDPGEVKITCSLSGISKQNPEIRFQLFDATEKSIGDNGVLELNGKIINESRTRASEIVDGFNTDRPSYEGSIDWRPPIADYGFYRVRVGMYNPETNQPIGDARSITVAVVEDQSIASERGEFGWSLPAADQPLPFSTLQELLPLAGVRLVKVPVWFPAGDDRRGDEIIHFAEQLAARGVETVGVLEDPSPRIADPLSKAPVPDIESLLSNDPSYWTPLVDHVITRLSLRIRWWQLGNDGDTGFVGHKDVVDRIDAIRNQMFRFGQDVRVGIGWRWEHPTDPDAPPSWDFLQMASRKPLDAAGLDAAFGGFPVAPGQRWVTVAPPNVALELPKGVDPADRDDPRVRQALVRRHEQRVRDFVEQILVAKIRGADGVFVSDPFSGSADASEEKTGVMNGDGTPGELLLPWKTCAQLLGGAEFIGSIRMPRGSSNWMFKRPDGRVAMVLWNLAAPTTEANATPIEEVLYLGDDAQIIDIWGGSAAPERRGHRQVVPVGRMPRFVLGVDESVARWRMAVRFGSRDVPSVFGVPHGNTIEFVNTFPQGVGGRVRVVAPRGDSPDPALSEEDSPDWSIGLDDDRFRVGAGESVRVPFEATLHDASFGEQPVRLDFEVVADRKVKFSVWRDLNVGLDGVTLAVASFEGPDGRLVIEQRMTKASGPPGDFKCLLYGDGRRRKRAQIYQLGPEGATINYTYLDPQGLVGSEMRLRIEEVDGPRVLIHRFVVAPAPRPTVREGESGREQTPLAQTR